MLEQSGSEPLRASALRQLLDLGFPFTLGEQGPFVARGIPAVTLTTVPRRPVPGLRRHPAQRRAPGRARPRDAESRRLARRRARADPGDDELRLSRHADRPRLGDRVRAADGAVAVPRSAPSTSSPAAAAGRIALAPRRAACAAACCSGDTPALLLFVAARLGAFPDGEPRPLPPDAGVYEPSPVVLGVLGALLVAGWLIGRERLIPRRAGDARGDARRPHGRAPRARPRRARRRRDEPVLPRLPAALAVRLALAAPGARREPASFAARC